jgi:hypothetical protein
MAARLPRVWSSCSILSSLTDLISRCFKAARVSTGAHVRALRFSQLPARRSTLPNAPAQGVPGQARCHAKLLIHNDRCSAWNERSWRGDIGFPMLKSEKSAPSRHPTTFSGNAMSASKAGPAGKVRRAEACNRARFPGFQALTQEKGGRNIGMFASPAPDCYFLPLKAGCWEPRETATIWRHGYRTGRSSRVWLCLERRRIGSP